MGILMKYVMRVDSWKKTWHVIVKESQYSEWQKLEIDSVSGEV